MALFITLVAMIVVFCLLWVAISYVPDSPRLPYMKTLLYVVLCLGAAFVVYQRFIA